VIGGIVGGVIGVAVAAPFTAIGLSWWRTVRSIRTAETTAERTAESAAPAGG
jgi:predicted PurR-regulated permease PerM